VSLVSPKWQTFAWCTLTTLALVACFGCAERKPVPLYTLEVTVSGFKLEKSALTSKADLVAALKALSPAPEAQIHVVPAQGVAYAQVSQAMEAIRESGVNAHVGIVGNEMFTK
jgi:biopolymer transport protein ExbD